MTRRHAPYIGVTGLATSGQTAFALSRHPECDRLLMVGVLASAKTLRGEPTRYAHRYPTFPELVGVMSRSARTLALVHYSAGETPEPQIAADLERIGQACWPMIDGLQLNLPWPSKTLTALARWQGAARRVVLQLGPSAQAMCGGDPRCIARTVSHYGDTITDVLVDGSGGRGLPLDTAHTLALVDAIADVCPDLGIGVAGGLCADTLGLVAEIAAKHPFVSIDAEGRLRDDADRLVLERVDGYLRAAAALLGGNAR